MSQGDVSLLLVAGGVFILLGIGIILLDRAEKKGYFSSISHHVDTREYLEAWPERPEFGALKLGGWISIIIGIALIVMGLVFRRFGI